MRRRKTLFPGGAKVSRVPERRRNPYKIYADDELRLASSGAFDLYGRSARILTEGWRGGNGTGSLIPSGILRWLGRIS
jgi:hypothetical protein